MTNKIDWNKLIETAVSSTMNSNSPGDIVDIKATPGEFIMPRESVDLYGKNYMNTMASNGNIVKVLAAIKEGKIDPKGLIEVIQKMVDSTRSMPPKGNVFGWGGWIPDLPDLPDLPDIPGIPSPSPIGPISPIGPVVPELPDIEDLPNIPGLSDLLGSSGSFNFPRNMSITGPGSSRSREDERGYAFGGTVEPVDYQTTTPRTNLNIDMQPLTLRGNNQSVSNSINTYNQPGASSNTSPIRSSAGISVTPKKPVTYIKPSSSVDSRPAKSLYDKQVERYMNAGESGYEPTTTKEKISAGIQKVDWAKILGTMAASYLPDHWSGRLGAGIVKMREGEEKAASEAEERRIKEKGVDATKEYKDAITDLKTGMYSLAQQKRIDEHGKIEDDLAAREAISVLVNTEPGSPEYVDAYKKAQAIIPSRDWPKYGLKPIDAKPTARQRDVVEITDANGKGTGVFGYVSTINGTRSWDTDPATGRLAIAPAPPALIPSGSVEEIIDPVTGKKVLKVIPTRGAGIGNQQTETAAPNTDLENQEYNAFKSLREQNADAGKFSYIDTLPRGGKAGVPSSAFTMPSGIKDRFTQEDISKEKEKLYPDKSSKKKGSMKDFGDKKKAGISNEASTKSDINVSDPRVKALQNNARDGDKKAQKYLDSKGIGY